MRQTSYWLETAPQFGAAVEGPVEGRADVVVMGGGFTGLSAALALAKRGASVALLEAGRVAAAGSGQNGGQCNNGLSHDYASLADSIGSARASAYYRAYDAAVDTVERLVREEAIDCAFQRNGKIKLAAKPEHFAKLAKSCERIAAEVDPDVALVPAAEVEREVGSRAYHGGLVYKKSAQLHVGKFGVGLAEAAAHHGARIYQDTLVTGLRRTPNGKYRVETARGTVEASQVFVATGSSRQGPLFYFRRRIVPVGSFIVVTEPLDQAVLDRIMPKRRTCTTSQNIGNHFRITPDGRLLFGGRARFALAGPQSDLKSGRILEHTMREVFPALSGTRVDYCWGGLIDMTQDRLPRAGERGDLPGVYYAMGYSGHGVQMSTHMGQCMAEVMTGKPDANPWRDLDWPAIPGHFGPPWFLPFVGLYYKVVDKLR